MTPEKRAELLRVARRSIQFAQTWASLDIAAAVVYQAAIGDPEVDALLARFEAQQPRRAAQQVAAILRHRARQKGPPGGSDQAGRGDGERASRRRRVDCTTP